jgi:hypothetical protein
MVLHVWSTAALAPSQTLRISALRRAAGLTHFAAMRSTPSADRFVARVADHLLSELARRLVAQHLVRVDRVVQGDETTPIRLMSARFSIRGIRGSGVLFMSVR